MEEMEYIQKYPTAATADVNSLGPSSITSTPTAEDALLRTACSRAVATFLSPNASKELPVDALVRDTVIRTLAYDCHPDVVSFLIDMFSQCSSCLHSFCLFMKKCTTFWKDIVSPHFLQGQAQTLIEEFR